MESTGTPAATLLLACGADGSLLSCLPEWPRDLAGGRPPKRIQSLLPEGAVFPPTNPHTVRLGARTFQLSVTEAPGGAAAGYWFSLTDVTHWERRLEEVENRLKKREEYVKELENFSYSVSHDLKAPLRHILNFGDLLEKESMTDGGDNKQAYLGYMLDSARSANAFIDAMLTYDRARRAKIKRRPLPLLNVVSMQMDKLRDDLGEQAVIDWQIDSLHEIYADFKWTGILFYQLLHNVIVHNPDRDKVVRVSCQKNEDGYLVMVEDNGKGIPKNQLKRVFLPCQSLSDQSREPRPGMGLAVAERIVQMHGGRIWAEAHNEGARIVFSLPHEDGEC